MANFINKDAVKNYIQRNNREVCNADLVSLECFVFGIVLDWIRQSKNKTLNDLNGKMMAVIAHERMKRDRKLAREKVCYVAKCRRYKKEKS